MAFHSQRGSGCGQQQKEEERRERQRGRLRDQEQVGIKMHEVGKPEVNFTSQRETDEDVHKVTVYCELLLQTVSHVTMACHKAGRP